MNELWNRTWKLFRHHPLLALPTVVAGLLSLWMERLTKIALHSIVDRLASKHSVLGGEVPNGDLADLQHRAMLVGMPLALSRQFLTVFLFVAALVVTAHLVRMISDGASPGFASALNLARSRWRSVVTFSLAFMGLVGILTLMGGTLLTLPAIASHLSPPAFQAALFIESAMMITLVAWFLAPWSLRFLQPYQALVTSRAKGLARAFAIAVFVLQPVFEKILLRVEAQNRAWEKWEYTGLAILNTAVTNLPLALLFIALGLLATEPAIDTLVEPEGTAAPFPLSREGLSDQ